MKALVLVPAVALCGCRIHFDPITDDGAVNTGDATNISCAGLAPTCGPLGDQPCCGSSVVPGGTFYRSYDGAVDAKYPDMTNPATVGAFRLDTYEVTVARFRVFVDAGRGTQLAPPGAGDGTNPLVASSGWVATWNTQLPADTATLKAAALCNTFQTWTDAPGANESLPINCVSWYVALAFCAWDGGFLPTEAEWNFAASGGDEQRSYPWSMPPAAIAIDCTQADYMGCMPGTSLVGTRTGLGRWGHADLAGNVWEWVLDASGTYGNPCNDCAAVTGTTRVVRGGSFTSTLDNLRSADRFQYLATAHTDNVGFRCARVP